MSASMCDQCVPTIEIVQQQIAASLAVLDGVRPDRDTRWRRWLDGRRGEQIAYSLVRCTDGVYRPEPDAIRFESDALDRMAREREWIETRERRHEWLR